MNVARQFESIMGQTDVPFVISIFNSETQRIEFVTNMSREVMQDFIQDMADQCATPETYQTYERGEGLQ